jgi:hypothetical protein
VADLQGQIMLSYLRKFVVPAAVLAGVAGFSIHMAQAEDKPAAAAEVKKGTISGTLVDKEGKAVAGAEIGIFKPQPRQPGAGGNRPNRGAPANQANVEDPKPAEQPAPGRQNRQRPEALFKSTTDAEGKFTIKDVPVGDYVAQVRTDKGMARERVTVAADSTVSVKLALADRPARGAGAGGAGGNRPNRPNRPAAQ